MPPKLTLTPESPSNFPAISEIHRIAFGQDNEAKLVEALRNNKKVFIPELSIVAGIDNKVTGHILFTRINIKDGNGNLHESLALAPMALRPEFQNCGIGGQLIRKGFETAKDLGFKSVIVLGHEHYYPKFGFEPAEKWNIKPPFEVSSNFFMAVELVPGGLKDISGTVIYPEEFEMV